MLKEQNKLPGADRLINNLPKLLLIVFALQPLMDILSYWMSVFEMSNTLTLILRLGVLAVVALAGFYVSQRKKAYFIAAGVFIALFAGHVFACMSVGYQDIVADTTNYVRVIQMPIFVMCFISFMRANDKCYEAIENGLIMNFWIITVSVVISLLTGTQNPTYQQTGIGVLGWFATSNAQSAVLSLLTCMVVTLCVLRKKSLPVFIITTVAAFLQLFLLGTRLAFLSIFVTSAGIIILMIVTKQFSKKHAVILVACLALCCVFFKQSPMYFNQQSYIDTMASKQYDAGIIMQRAEDELDPSADEQARHMAALRVLYKYYSKNLSERFGVDVVMEKYDYTYTISDLTAVRNQKINFCKLLMDEHPFVSRIFGMELGRMQYNDYVYDVENDFHGIYFLFGAAGLLLMLAFIGYFIYLVVKALIKNFKKYFNMQSGAYGMALCVALLYAYCTAGVLRRPNSSFYLSVILAAVYYIVMLKKDWEPEEKEQIEA